MASSKKNRSENGPKGLRNICVGEEFRIAVTLTLEKFRYDAEQKEIEFPSSLTAAERAYIHRLCLTMGLASKSKGSGMARFITVSKKDCALMLQSASAFQMIKNSRQQVQTLLQRLASPVKNARSLFPGVRESVCSILLRSMAET